MTSISMTAVFICFCLSIHVLVCTAVVPVVQTTTKDWLIAYIFIIARLIFHDILFIFGRNVKLTLQKKISHAP